MKLIPEQLEQLEQAADMLHTSICLISPKEATIGPAGIMSQMMIAENVKEDYKKLRDAIKTLRGENEPKSGEREKELEQASNICDQCGGVKEVYFEVRPVLHSEITSQTPEGSMILARTQGTFHLCNGHPDPKPKHDGKLDTWNGANVWRCTSACSDSPTGPCVHLSVIGQSEIVLFPRQALSLLAWLEQERETLERQVKEAEHG